MQQPADPFYAASKNALLEAVPYAKRFETGYGVAPEGIFSFGSEGNA
jgi:hypothetical protein